MLNKVLHMINDSVMSGHNIVELSEFKDICIKDLEEALINLGFKGSFDNTNNILIYIYEGVVRDV